MRGKKKKALRAVLLGAYVAAVALTAVCLIVEDLNCARLFHIIMWMLSVIVAADLLEEVL